MTRSQQGNRNYKNIRMKILELKNTTEILKVHWMDGLKSKMELLKESINFRSEEI